MNYYQSQQVREADIHFIVNEIIAFADCVERKQMLIGALELPPSIGVDLELKYRHDDFNIYKYFRGVISHWINWKGNQASTLKLDNALKSIGWNAAADNVKDKWFIEARPTAGPSNVRVAPNSIQNTGPASFWFNMRDPIPSYTGREEELSQVHNLFFPPNEESQSTHQVAVVGLGGIGKSEFARKFAQKYYPEFDRNVVWINAESAQLLQESFTELAAEIGLGRTNGSDKNDFLKMIKSVYEHFSASNSLFIFDNVEAWVDGEDAINDYLPKGLKPDSKTPYILMTSRNRPKVSNRVAIVEISVLTEREAVQLIQYRLDTEDFKLPLQLANLLGCLPLALQQAISYIQQEIDEDISGMARQGVANCIQSYIEIFGTEAKKLLDYKDSDFDAEFKELKPTRLTWRITLEKIQKLNPSAIQLLEMMSYISPDDIHLEMFRAQFTVQNLKAAANTLFQFSMISKHSANPNIVSVHRLVQSVVRLDQEENSLKEVLKLLNVILKELPDKITPYTTSCVIHAQVAWEYALAYPRLLKQFEHYPTHLYNNCNLHGMHTANLSLLHQTLSKYKLYSIYKESNGQYIRIQHLIASGLLDLQKYDDAKSLYQIIHKTAAEKLRESHPLTLDILNGLAVAEGILGNYSEQIIILDKVIAIKTATPNIGPCHKATLTSLHNKAVGLADMGKYDEAFQIFKSTLELMKKHHPEDRKSINETRYMVAAMTQRQGNYAEALQVFKNVHAEREESFGESHADTLRCARQIGECLLELGKYKEAMEVLKYNLNLAINNPGARLQCAKMQFSIAKVLLQMKRYDEAVSQFRIVLEEKLSIYGETHPEVLSTREQLADALKNAGRTEEALEHYKFVYENRMKALGVDHPNTRRVNDCMGAIFNKQSIIGRGDTLEKVHDVTPKKVRDDANNKFTEIGKIGYSHADQMGNGATGIVYQGYFETRNVRAAVKIMLSNQTRIYENEINIMRKLNHPSIIRYFASESYQNSNFIAMELADQNLDDFVKATPQNPLNEICGLLQDTCNGLQRMHSEDIIHRDIKPHNILIFLKMGKHSGSKVLTAKISDFGISKVISDVAAQSTAKGTLLFMSHECMKAYDEQREFSSTKQSDIFSLGLTFYYALTYGKHACGSPARQIINLCEGKLIFDDLKDEKFALYYNLVKGMLRLDPLERPPIDVICQYPFFWNNNRCLSFVNDVNSFILSKQGTFLKTELENLSFDWYARLDSAVAEYLDKEDPKEKYTRTSLVELVRFIRNKNAHLEWPFEVKQVWGEGSARKEKYIQYFTDRFPFLIPHLYVLVQKFRLGSGLDSYYNCDKVYFDDSAEYLTTISQRVLQGNANDT